jgi:tetratricopeptide (TPR) repeat protein
VLILWGVISGCCGDVDAQPALRTPVFEVARDFTNRLARGTVTERLASVEALSRLAREGWDKPSFELAVDALLHAVGDGDTNIQASARRAWSGFHPGFSAQGASVQLDLLPSWTSNVVGDCALRGLSSDWPAVRSAAGRALLSRDARQPGAAAALLACLEAPEPGLRSEALAALTAVAVQNPTITTNLLVVLRWQLESPEALVQLRGVEGLWKLGVVLKAPGFCADAERKLAQLLASGDITVQRPGARWVMDSMYGSGPVSEALRAVFTDTIDHGDPEVALALGWATQRLVPGEPSPELSAKRRAAFLRGIRDGRPALRRGALDSLRTDVNDSWWAVIKDIPEPETPSRATSILTSTPVTNRRLVRSTAQPEIVAALTNALAADPDLGVRLRAARAVLWLEDLRRECDSAVRRVLSDGLEAKDPETLRLTLGLFSDRTWASGQSRLLTSYKEWALSSDDGLRRLVCESVWAVPRTGIPGFWEPLCASRDPAIRAVGARLLVAQAGFQNWPSNAPWTSIPRTVEALIRDPFPQVSAGGMDVLRTLTFSTNQTAVRAQAVEWLTRLATDSDRFVKARLAQSLAFGGAGPPASSTEKPLLLTLARDADPVVRRLAACSLRSEPGGPPSELRNDPDLEVRRIAQMPGPRQTNPVRYPGQPARSRDLDSVAQELKGGTAEVRRKAALELVNDVVTRQRAGLQQEVFEALLQCYGGDSEADLRRVNLAFSQIAFGPQWATRARQTCLMCVAEIPKAEELTRRGLWALLAGTLRGYGRMPLSSLPVADAQATSRLVLEGTRSVDPAIRIPAIQCLQPLSASLDRGQAEARDLAAQARTVLVRALKDDQPGAVVAAVSGLIDGGAADNADPRLTLPEESLRKEAMQSLGERLEASLPAVRSSAAAALALLAAWQPDPDLAERAIRSMGADSVDFGPSGYGPSPAEASSLTRLPSINGGGVLVRIALEAPDVRTRQCAMGVLVAALGDHAKFRDGRLSPLLSELQRRGQRGGVGANDVRPLVQRLLGLASGSEPTAASAWASVRTLVQGSPGAWETVSDWIESRAKSANALQRREAMDRLAELLQTVPSGGRVERVAVLPVKLLSDSDSNVRASAAKAIAAAQRNDGSPMATAGADMEILAERLLELSAGDGMDAADARASLGSLMTSSESVRQIVAQWVDGRARSADPGERRAALDWLSSVLGRVANDCVCEFARRFATRMAGDSDVGVQLAALRTFGRSFQSNPPVSAEENGVVAAALKSDNPQVRQAAAVAVAARVQEDFAREVVEGAAAEIVDAIPHLETYSVAQHYLHRLLARVPDQAVQDKALAAIRERLVELDNDGERAIWLTTVGEIELARNEPGAAVTAFQHALRLTPDGNAGVRSRLDKALWAAGRGSEALAADAPPRLSVFEVEERVRALVPTGDVQKILRVVNQALDGLVPTYGSQQPRRGFGEPDMIIARVLPVLMAMNQPALYEQFISDALKRFPDNATALQELAKWRVQQGRQNDAVALYERALLANPWDWTAFEAFKELCRKAGVGLRFEALGDKLLEISPADPAVNRVFTRYYVEQGKTNVARQLVARYRQAIEHPERPFSTDPGEPDLEWRQAALAEMLAATGDYDGAIAIQQRVGRSENGKSHFDQRTVLDWLRRAGRTNEYAAAVQADPKVRLGELQDEVREQLNSGAVDAALATARQVLAIDLAGEERRLAWNELASAFLWNRADKAALLFGEFVSTHPDDTDALGILANVDLARGEIAQAITHAEHANRVKPGDPATVSTLATAYLQGGRFSDAIALLEAVSRSPERFQDTLLLANAYAARGDTDGLNRLAADVERRTAGDTTENTLARRDLARIRDLEGQTEEAARLMLGVLRDTRVRGGGDRQTLVRWYKQLNRLDDAIALCTQPVLEPRQEPWRSQELCRLYLLKGMTNEAADALDRSHASAFEQIRAGTADAQLYNHVAWAYVENRVRLASALEYARKAAVLSPDDGYIRDTLAWAALLNGDGAAALAAFAPAITNVAEANPGLSVLSSSAWKGLTELAEAPTANPALLDALSSWHVLPGASPVALARVDLVLSIYHGAHGDQEKAAESRAASGYPAERRWLMLGPFPNEADRGIDEAYVPEDRVEIDRAARYPGRGRVARWESRFDGIESGVVALDAMFANSDWAIGYAWTTVESEAEQQAELRLATTGNARVWLNGGRCYEHRGDRPLTLDGDVQTVTLRPGSNTILVKLSNRRGAWQFSVRLTRPGGGALDGVTF